MPITASMPGFRSPEWDAPGVLHVIAENPHTLQEDLALAVEQVRGATPHGDRRGILLTRRSRSLFTVETSTDVPHGTTLEKDRWHRRPAADSTGPADVERESW